MANEYARIALLRHLQRDSKASNAELVEAAGLADKQGVTYHLQCLEREGLVLRAGNGRGATRTLSPCAELVLKYCDVAQRGPSLWSRTLGAKRYGVAGEVQRVAEELDLRYSYKPTAGLLRRKRSGEGRELERKASWCDIIEAAKASHSVGEAAAKVGLERSALRERLQKLMRLAKGRGEAEC